jgi:hypothetical protein
MVLGAMGEGEQAGVIRVPRFEQRDDRHTDKRPVERDTERYGLA